MKRTLAVLGWMLFGAVACGAGFGYFFYQANTDRQALATRVQTCETQVAEYKTTNEKLAVEANKKVEDAAKQILLAEQKTQACESERSRLAAAKSLVKPDSRTLRSWKQTLSLTLGISLQVPPGTTIQESDNRLDATNEHAQSLSYLPWLSIQAYSPTEEARLANGLTQIQSVDFVVDGNLVSGVRGTNPSLPGTIYVLHLSTGEKPSHLIWAYAENTTADKKIENTLATLALRS